MSPKKEKRTNLVKVFNVVFKNFQDRREALHLNQDDEQKLNTIFQRFNDFKEKLKSGEHISSIEVENLYDLYEKAEEITFKY